MSLKSLFFLLASFACNLLQLLVGVGVRVCTCFPSLIQRSTADRLGPGGFFFLHKWTLFMWLIWMCLHCLCLQPVCWMLMQTALVIQLYMYGTRNKGWKFWILTGIKRSGGHSFKTRSQISCGRGVPLSARDSKLVTLTWVSWFEYPQPPNLTSKYVFCLWTLSTAWKFQSLFLALPNL